MASRPLRVLQLCAIDFTFHQFLAPLALRLLEAGYEVKGACARGPYWEAIEARGVPMIEAAMSRRSHPAALWRAVRSVHRILRAERIDILHVHTPIGALVGRIAARLARTPRVVYTAHGFYFHDRMPRPRRDAHVLLERALAPLTDELCCVSREDARTARALRLLPPRHIQWTPNGVDTERFHPRRFPHDHRHSFRAANGLPEDAFVVLAMGRLVREKGFGELLEAAARLAPLHPRLHLAIAGDTVTSEYDAAKEQLLAKAHTPPLEGRVTFLGMRRDMPEVLAASDLFCLPSYREGMPVSLMEAMAAGLPCVATRIRGCRELIREGREGLLVDPQNADELAGAIGWMMTNPGHASAMARDARRRIRSHFREDQALYRVLGLYGRMEKGMAR